MIDKNPGHAPRRIIVVAYPPPCDLPLGINLLKRVDYLKYFPGVSVNWSDILKLVKWNVAVVPDRFK